MEEDFSIRKLTKEDIKQIAKAREAQEKENGNYITKYYIESYKNVIKKLLDEKKLVAVGAFNGKNIVSIACYNLINLGNEKKIPYLCAVWTDVQYRGKKLASMVNKKLTESILELKNQLQPKTLLTFEGNKPAHNMYIQLGYKSVDWEMSFLGDAQKVSNPNFKCKISKKNSQTKSIEYYENSMLIMEVLYSEEQFLPHPSNIDGRMTKIIGIRDVQKGLNKNSLNVCLQHFFAEHRFCKFNVKELLEFENRLYEILGVENECMQEVVRKFENLKFIGKDNKVLNITESNSVMERDLSKEFSSTYEYTSKT
ncbi:MAG: GNAT family N-acetyltransferase [Clostridia bacterium]|nr:GNAT family N-acetyltransferase [Clostridia bacterium]